MCQVNGGAETSSTELIRKSSQAELGVGFFEGDEHDSHPKLEDSKHTSNHYFTRSGKRLLNAIQIQ